MIRKQEINRIPTDFGLLDKFYINGFQSKPNCLFEHVFASKSAITSQATKLTFTARDISKLFIAMTASFYQRWTATFLRAILACIPCFTMLKDFAASFASTKLNSGVSTLNTANGISIGIADDDGKLFSANGTNFSNSFGGGIFTSARAIALSPFVSTWSKVKRFTTCWANHIMAGSFAFCFAIFEFFGCARHGIQSLINLPVLYQKLCVTSKQGVAGQ